MQKAAISKAVLYLHGKGGSAAEAEHYRLLFPGDEVIGFDYHAQTPWEAKEEFPAFFETLGKQYDTVLLIANSIGAYFAMSAPVTIPIEKAYFISPIVDMERLIRDMMQWAGVTEKLLREKKEIPTSFGETLSWEYYGYVREHPITWRVPTRILYGEKDSLTAFETVSAFAGKSGAEVTVMPGGEHWFHTKEQMAFLDRWILNGEGRAERE